MNNTRLSLYYLAVYLWLGGIGLIIAPSFPATLLISNTEYASVMLQSLGMFMIGLGVVVQIIRLRIMALYPTTLVVRLFFCTCLMGFCILTDNPFFIVPVGMLCSACCSQGSAMFRNGAIPELLARANLTGSASPLRTILTNWRQTDYARIA